MLKPNQNLKNLKILVTGGAGFIGSNLCEFLISSGSRVVCLDNFSTGHRHNIKTLLSSKQFKLIEGDICELKVCKNAVKGIDFVLHQAALGSVPRSIKDPLTSNEVNISGFLNMLIASRDEGVKRFIYAASSSTYGDSNSLPKIENTIGSPLSPYAVTKFVNELYAHIFKISYDFDSIGLRYFNVFGRRQDPNGAYAAVIPKFVMQLIKGESPVVNGDGSFSRDFTYIDNVINMNVLSILTNDKNALNQIYNTAYGESNTLIQLITLIKEKLSKFDSKVESIEVLHGDERKGDIPHSLASIEKAKSLLGYEPSHNLDQGLTESIDWYYNYFNS